MLKFYWQKRIWYNQCSLTSFYIFRGKIFKSSRFPRKVSVCLCLRTYHKRTFFWDTLHINIKLMLPFLLHFLLLLVQINILFVYLIFIAWIFAGMIMLSFVFLTVLSFFIIGIVGPLVWTRWEHGWDMIEVP